MARLIAPSLLAADFGRLQQEIDAVVNKSEADMLHMDVMDGLFVPNFSIGIPVVEAARKYCTKPLDVHLMIVKPERYLEAFHSAGASFLTVHLEASKHLNRTIQEIKRLGMKAGVSLNPHTTVSLLEEIITELDLVLIMSVNPGFGGQRFIPSSLDKIKKLRKLIDETGSHALIEVDGGIDEINAGMIFEAGADILVAGTSVFRSSDPVKAILQLKNAGL
ncbi:MAG: ribulose-phosphate 3-epimerase [Bacteroidales bacterium]|nr:ribulose-phosphate 3-epimerase [Bacteroidales bacterium]